MNGGSGTPLQCSPVAAAAVARDDATTLVASSNRQRSASGEPSAATRPHATAGARGHMETTCGGLPRRCDCSAEGAVSDGGRPGGLGHAPPPACTTTTATTVPSGSPLNASLRLAPDAEDLVREVQLGKLLGVGQCSAVYRGAWRAGVDARAGRGKLIGTKPWTCSGAGDGVVHTAWSC